MADFVTDLITAKQYYAEIRFDTLPLMPGTKQASVKTWQGRPSFELWCNSESEYNIGIRCGGKSQIAVIDCDDKERPGTAENTFSYLFGLGPGLMWWHLQAY